MKVEFTMEKKKSVIEGQEVEYYVLVTKLVTGDMLQVPIKGDKAKLLALSYKIQQNQK